MQLCDLCFLKNAGVKSHRSEPHCSWHRGLFFPFPSPNRALLCHSLAATQLQLPRMSPGQEGYSYCQQCFLCSWNSQNSDVKSLVCWLNLQCAGEKPCVCKTGVTKGQRPCFQMPGGWTAAAVTWQHFHLLRSAWEENFCIHVWQNQSGPCFLWISHSGDLSIQGPGDLKHIITGECENQIFW